MDPKQASDIAARARAEVRDDATSKHHDPRGGGHCQRSWSPVWDFWRCWGTSRQCKTSNLLNFNDTDVTIGAAVFKSPTKKSFSPRVGVVWAPQAGRTSVRGGFGVFYEHPMLYNIRTSLSELPPFVLSGRIDGAGIANLNDPMHSCVGRHRRLCSA